MKLTKQQKNAINHKDGPALILAVPGSGKTTVLIQRTHKLIYTDKVSPENILSLTFSKASALDMKNRFHKFFPEIKFSPHFSTIHSFCFHVLNKYAIKKQLKFKLIEGNNKYNKFEIVKKIYSKHNNKYINDDELEKFFSYSGYIKNMLIPVNDFVENFKSEIPNFKLIFNDYENLKRKNNLIDFDDMLTITLYIFSKYKTILNYYQNRYKYIQVDEAQDTSRLQMKIISMIAKPHNNLFLVADDDQSIYGFRGAYPNNILNFSKLYNDAKIFYMEENFRSGQNIVKTSNLFIKKNSNRYNKNIFTKNKFKDQIKIINTKNSIDQYKYILNILKKLNYKNTAILYRNNISLVGILNLFYEFNIPFKVKDQNLTFFNHWIIYDILNILKFSEDTTNLSIYEKFYYKIKGYISKKQINFCKNLNYKESVFTRIREYPEINDFYIDQIFDLENSFSVLKTLPPFKAIEYIEHDLGYKDYLFEYCDKFGYNFNNFMKIIHYLKIISKNCKTKIELEDKIISLRENFYKKSSKSGVTLSTMHSSKGLEFNNVFIIDLIEDEIPNIKAIEKNSTDPKKEIEEERRLLYVAMTRAKENLYMTFFDYLNNNLVEPSTFIQELNNIS